MVRMQVADEHGIEAGRVQQPGEPGERALAKVEQEGTVAAGQEVGRARRAGTVRVCRPGADDREIQRAVA